MSEIISSLDKLNNIPSIKSGENGHLEFNWSNDIQEKITQFSFQLTRITDFNNSKLMDLSQIFTDILSDVKNKLDNGLIEDKINANIYLCILYKMIGYTRDIISGKGEYNLTYMMIYNWFKFYPELAKYALKCCVELGSNCEIHPYGSWKDIKYFCNYILQQNLKKTYVISDETLIHPFIPYCVQLVNDRLRKDALILDNNDNDYSELSLVAKWIPREKSSKFGWLFKILAEDYFANYLNNCATDEAYDKAILKCKTHYRKLISKINKKLDTLQIYQCSNNWSEINFNKVTSISLIKQKKAFLNVDKKNNVRYKNNSDRIKCAQNFNKFIETNENIKGGKISMCDFTKQALSNLSENEINLINSQWKDNSNQNKSLENMIAMVDVSSSMDGTPMNAAIALGIRIAEKSKLGKRIMTFSAKPSWINLDDYNDFVSQVRFIRKADWGMNTNFYSALDLILNAIIENKMHPKDVKNMTLVILSDMQMDVGDKCDKKTLYENIKAKYEDAGLRICGIPYDPPHILFWNLRSTDGFPCLANSINTSMMSGFSPVLLNQFCQHGKEALNNYTPWNSLVACLNNDRFKYLEDKYNEIM